MYNTHTHTYIHTPALHKDNSHTQARIAHTQTQFGNIEKIT